MITDLLDQIDRLDQQATKGPWDHTVEWAEIGSGSDSVIHGYGYAHCDGCDEAVESVDSRVALSPQDAEFIALARTALPTLAKALRAVMELHKTRVHDEDPTSPFCNFCGPGTPCETTRAITDALGADDA